MAENCLPREAKGEKFYFAHKIWPLAAKLSWPIIEFGRQLPN